MSEKITDPVALARLAALLAPALAKLAEIRTAAPGKATAQESNGDARATDHTATG